MIGSLGTRILALGSIGLFIGGCALAAQGIHDASKSWNSTAVEENGILTARIDLKSMDVGDALNIYMKGDIDAIASICKPLPSGWYYEGGCVRPNTWNLHHEENALEVSVDMSWLGSGTYELVAWRDVEITSCTYTFSLVECSDVLGYITFKKE